MMCQTNLLSDYGCLYLLLPKAKPKLLCFYFFLDSNQNSRISASSRISRVPFRTREQQFTLIPSGSIVNNRKKWRIRNRSDFHWKEAARISCQEFSFSGRVKGYTTMDPIDQRAFGDPGSKTNARRTSTSLGRKCRADFSGSAHIAATPAVSA